MSGVVTFVLRALIRAYQLLIAPMLGPVCRFTPSCSAYTAEAIAVHGALRGTGLGIARLCRCHPWGGEGHDPVPQRFHCAVVDTTS